MWLSITPYFPQHDQESLGSATVLDTYDWQEVKIGAWAHYYADDSTCSTIASLDAYLNCTFRNFMSPFSRSTFASEVESSLDAWNIIKVSNSRSR